MKYTEKDLISAFEYVLGHDVVQAMLNAGILLPSIHQVAVKKIFMTDFKGFGVDVIRQSLFDLERNGKYDFSKLKESLDENQDMTITDIDYFENDAYLNLDGKKIYFQWEGARPPTVFDAVSFIINEGICNG